MSAPWCERRSNNAWPSKSGSHVPGNLLLGSRVLTKTRSCRRSAPVRQKNRQPLKRPDHNKDIASIRRQAAEGGLTFEAYLPPGLAEWVISLVEQEVFHSPSEAVIVAMQSFLELDDHPDVKHELLKRTLQNRMASADQGGGMPAEDVMERLRKALEGLRAEPAVWDKSLDRPLFPNDS